MILWLVIFILVIFTICMFVITPYENDKTQQKVMMICAIVFNLINGINIPLILYFALMKQFTYTMPRGYYINPKALIITIIIAIIYFGLFVFLNMLFIKKGKMELKKYLALSTLGIIIGFLINGFIKVYLWMMLALL